MARYRVFSSLEIDTNSPRSNASEISCSSRSSLKSSSRFIGVIFADNIISSRFSTWKNCFEKYFLFIFYKRNKIGITPSFYEENFLIWIFSSVWMINGGKDAILDNSRCYILKTYTPILFQPSIFLFAPLNLFHTSFQKFGLLPRYYT